MKTEEHLSPEEQVMRILGAKWIAAAVAAAASLRLAEAVEGYERDAEALAQALECDRDYLERIMRVLVGEGFFVRDAVSGVYAITELGQQLKYERLGAVAEYIGKPFVWNPWARLADAARQGVSPFRLEFGESLFPFLERDVDAAGTYHEGVEAFSRIAGREIVRSFNFRDVQTVADLGGGQGSLLSRVLEDNEQITGILVDRPAALELARARVEGSGVASRMTFDATSFFDSVPLEQDVYILKHVLHNWDDERCETLLSNVRRAMHADSVLLAIDGFVTPGGRKDFLKLFDLEMMALCEAGRERSKPEFRHLFHKCGLRLHEARSLSNGARLMVVRPRPM